MYKDTSTYKHVYQQILEHVIIHIRLDHPDTCIDIILASYALVTTFDAL